MKRPPGLGKEYRERFAVIPKARWYDLYADLYRQCFGEDASDADVMTGAEQRRGILDSNDA